MEPKNIEALVKKFCEEHGLTIHSYENVVFKHTESGNFFYAAGVEDGVPTNVGYWTERTGYYYE